MGSTPPAQSPRGCRCTAAGRGNSCRCWRAAALRAPTSGWWQTGLGMANKITCRRGCRTNRRSNLRSCNNAVFSAPNKIIQTLPILSQNSAVFTFDLVGGEILQTARTSASLLPKVSAEKASLFPATYFKFAEQVWLVGKTFRLSAKQRNSCKGRSFPGGGNGWMKWDHTNFY